MPALRCTLLLVCVASACADPPDLSTSDEATSPPGLAARVRQEAAAAGVTALPPAPTVRPALVALGRALAFDKLLSGNRDISCMTCHHPTLATTDARSLSIGQGGSGLGPSRTHPDGTFIPRNAPPLYNLDALSHLFWDGRVSDVGGALSTPAGAQLTPAMTAVFEFGAVSAQPMFPPTSRAEMRGAGGSNEVARLADGDLGGIWNALAARVRATSGYRTLFEAAYPGTPFASLTFAHLANAIAGFEIATFAMRGAPWDHFLAGDDSALSTSQLKGAEVFFGKGGCAQCHRGPDLTDEEFDDTALPQLGPGEGDGADGRDDLGRARVTNADSDRDAFRTAPLRNVALTGPWGHDGAFSTLRGFVAHYQDPGASLETYDPSQLEPDLKTTVIDNDSLSNLAAELADLPKLNDRELDDLVTFLSALTDPSALDQSAVVPASVPSGLPVD